MAFCRKGMLLFDSEVTESNPSQVWCDLHSSKLSGVLFLSRYSFRCVMTNMLRDLTSFAQTVSVIHFQGSSRKQCVRWIAFRTRYAKSHIACLVSHCFPSTRRNISRKCFMPPLWTTLRKGVWDFRAKINIPMYRCGKDRTGVHRVLMSDGWQWLPFQYHI